MFSHTKLLDGQSGTDNWASPVTYFRLFGTRSLLPSRKNDTSITRISRLRNNESANRIWWFDEYEKIDLGKAVGPIYRYGDQRREYLLPEFEKGYVLVNPTATALHRCLARRAGSSRTTICFGVGSIPIVSSVSLAGHNAASSKSSARHHRSVNPDRTFRLRSSSSQIICPGCFQRRCSVAGYDSTSTTSRLHDDSYVRSSTPA